jgi:hypothetical protein
MLQHRTGRGLGAGGGRQTGGNAHDRKTNPIHANVLFVRSAPRFGLED